jgi:hypothetical protein
MTVAPMSAVPTRLYADSVPGHDAPPCRCFYALERALGEPDGPFRIDLREPSWLGHAEVTLAGVQLRYCPRCGGRLAAFRPEVIAAHARYRTAREGYVFLQGKLDYDVAGPLCLACGCVLDVQGDMQRTWVDPKNHLRVVIQWDPDHDCLYGHCEFLPGPELLASPFVPRS